MASGRCFVEIFCRKNSFITFDFGNFAIVVESEVSGNRNKIAVYIGKNYEKQFINSWHRQMGSNPVFKTKEISLEALNEIKEACPDGNIISGNGFCGLLKKHFPQYIKEYGR